MGRIGPGMAIAICSLLIIIMGWVRIVYPELIYFNSGFVLVILLTILVRSNLATWFFGCLSLLIIFVSVLLSKQYNSLHTILPEALSAGVIVISLLVVLHIKNLYRFIDHEKRHLNALFQYATEGVILTNQRGEIVLVNPAALRLFGYEEKELLGMKVEVLLPSRVHERHVHYRSDFYKNPGNRTMGHGRDLYARHKSGQEFPVEVSLSHFSQKEGFYVIAFIVDITQRKQAEQRLIEQKDKLEQTAHTIQKLNSDLETKVEERTLILKEALRELERSQKELSDALDKEKELNEIKSRFVSMASHEFRTPLSTVLSSASLIGKYTEAAQQDRRDKHVQRIKDSVKHLNDLLEDFLSLGKLEEGKIGARPALFDVKEFLDEICEEMRTVLKEGQQLEAGSVSSGEFFSDKKLLKNILINLISNASKFSSEGDTVRIEAAVSEKQLVITVIDQGIGISEEDQQHLFTSFYRGRNAVNIQGTGLGLHIIKRYLDLLNGHVQIRSELGKGTTVIISVPHLHA